MTNTTYTLSPVISVIIHHCSINFTNQPIPPKKGRRVFSGSTTIGGDFLNPRNDSSALIGTRTSCFDSGQLDMVPAKVGSCNTPVVSTTKITLAPDAEFPQSPKQEQGRSKWWRNSM